MITKIHDGLSPAHVYAFLTCIESIRHDIRPGTGCEDMEVNRTAGDGDPAGLANSQRLR